MAAILPLRPGTPLIDIAIPVYNEEGDLDQSVRRLRRYLDHRFPFEARITIVDNGSTDRTSQIASALAIELPGVRAERLEDKGRGRAIRQAWVNSNASVLVYMDVDLSTDLNALLPLVAPLISGHSEVATGSRLAQGARVVRSLKREIISRAYNLLLHLALGTRIRDAQCGFKAMRADVAHWLLPQVEDQGWFFDTELLVRAQREGLRIHEVAVDWVEDADTRVQIVPVAMEDLRGIWRLADEARTFMTIGILSTLAYVACFNLLRMALPASIANAVSLLITAVGNTAANRRFTFAAHQNGAAARDHIGGLTAFGIALGLTTGAIGALHGLAPSASRGMEIVVVMLANLLATVVRFILLRNWICRATDLRPASRSGSVRRESATLGIPRARVTVHLERLV